VTKVPENSVKNAAAVCRVAGKIPGAMGRGPKQPRGVALLGSVGIVSAMLSIALVATATDGVSATSAATGAPFTFAFAGDPATPLPWNPSSWDVVVNSRDLKTFSQLEGMQAQHGSNCGPYPGTHFNSSYEGAVFQCHNHVMTAINASGYGEIVLTPDHMVDFSGGASTISFKLSTLRTSYRDWVDVWITPFDSNLVLPLDEKVDLQGPPLTAIHVRMDQANGTIFRAERIDNFQVQQLPIKAHKTMEKMLGTTSAVTRTTLALTVSATHVKFGIPDLGYYWIDTDIAPLKWTRGIVQLSHHSYNPLKGCVPSATLACTPNTWHWSDFYISNAIPFTLLRGDKQVVHGVPTLVTFPSRAPQSAFLRFAAIGTIEVSFDGKSWQPAKLQNQSRNQVEHFSNYWMPVPAGTTSVTIRGKDWRPGPWWVRDISIWSTTAPAAIAPPAATAPPHAPTPSTKPAVKSRTTLAIVLTALVSPNAVKGELALFGLATLAGIGFLWWSRRRRARLRRD
jgi:hypothetical protein